jgi:hypothetical protein
MPVNFQAYFAVRDQGIAAEYVALKEDISRNFGIDSVFVTFLLPIIFSHPISEYIFNIYNGNTGKRLKCEII